MGVHPILQLVRTCKWWLNFINGTKYFEIKYRNVQKARDTTGICEYKRRLRHNQVENKDSNLHYAWMILNHTDLLYCEECCLFKGKEEGPCRRNFHSGWYMSPFKFCYFCGKYKCSAHWKTQYSRCDQCAVYKECSICLNSVLFKEGSVQNNNSFYRCSKCADSHFKCNKCIK